MKNTLILLMLFLILGGGTAWYLLTQKGETTSLANQDYHFEVEDTDQIHKIFLADRKGNQTTLERKNGYWLYNGKYRARPNAIENLLDAVKRVRMKNRLTNAAVPVVVKSLATHGIKVELYDKSGDAIKKYYVGGTTNTNEGTYMIMEDSDMPYVTHIPSWVGSLRPRYFLTGDQWRDKTIFGIEPDAIASVSVEYPLQRNKSFKLEVKGGEIEVKPFYDLSQPIAKPLNPSMAQAYLVGFRSLVAEAFQNGHEDREETTAKIPFSIVTILDKNGNERSAQFHPIYLYTDDGKLLMDSDVMGAETSVERYHVLTNNDDFMLVQHGVFRGIFWSYDAFFKS